MVPATLSLTLVCLYVHLPLYQHGRPFRIPICLQDHLFGLSAASVQTGFDPRSKVALKCNKACQRGSLASAVCFAQDRLCILILALLVSACASVSPLMCVCACACAGLQAGSSMMGRLNYSTRAQNNAIRNAMTTLLFQSGDQCYDDTL